MTGTIFSNRGVGPGCNTHEASNRLSQLKEEMDELDRRERELDMHKLWVQQSIKNVTDDVTNHQYPFCNFTLIYFCNYTSSSIYFFISHTYN